MHSYVVVALWLLHLPGVGELEEGEDSWRRRESEGRRDGGEWEGGIEGWRDGGKGEREGEGMTKGGRREGMQLREGRRNGERERDKERV